MPNATVSQDSNGTDQWRAEIGFLGSILGDTIRDQAGQEAFELVEKIRRLSWLRRTGDVDAAKQLKDVFSTIDHSQIRVVIRAFTIFLDLLNLVEDRTRTHVLRQRCESAFPETPAESIGQAFVKLKENHVSDKSLRELLDRIKVELVFTAHPTEAKRRSVRRKLREIRSLVAEYHDESLQYRRDQIENSIYRELALLWQTNFIRPWRPSVRQEVQRGLSIKSVLWDVIPIIAEELRVGCQRHYGETVEPSSVAITFGSWIGGDRDGHPGVNHTVTKETLQWLRCEAIQNHLEACDKLFHMFTVSNRQVDLGTTINLAIESAIEKSEKLNAEIALIPPDEMIRRWLAVINWRLGQTLSSLEQADSRPGVYCDSRELAEDVGILIDAVSETPHASLTLDPLLAWKTQIDTFGFHLAKLDIRQNSTVYRKVVNELLSASGLEPKPDSLSEAARCELLTSSSCQITELESLSDDARELISLFSVLHEHARSQGIDALGAQIVSMTSTASDILSVSWLWNSTRPEGSEESGTPQLVPLLETVDDLENGPGILQQLFSIDAYRSQLALHGNRQMIMLGYSDSTKDGGYLSACWALHESQRELSRVATQNDVSLTFFHGRGGSLGRGGGPAARSILSLPRSTFDGTIRITEQGEVLAERYDDPEIAHRHLEQMVWSSLLAAGLPSDSPESDWCTAMQTLATRSRIEYRKLVEKPRFVEFFRSVTPISEIEQLPIGSRPSRRKPGGGLGDLRAIPWVFSWTQCRCLLPAWFGLGTAITELTADAGVETLRTMYERWPFFRATIDNAELALAKADKDIMLEYFELVGDDTELSEIGETIYQELIRSVQAVLAITSNKEILANIDWLKESIRVRNRFIDPLNLLQAEMRRRWKDNDSDDATDEEHRHLMRLAINGVASGMRTSG